MHPNGKKRTKTWVLGPMVWIMSVHCDKLWYDFVSQTFTLIAPVWHVLHQVSCSNEMVANAPKCKETRQNMCLGSNSVDRERSLPKILTRHRGQNFCINCTSLVCFAAIFLCNSETVPNAPKRKETHQNMSLGSNGVDQECSFRKILTRHHCTNVCINYTSWARFAPSFVQ